MGAAACELCCEGLTLRGTKEETTASPWKMKAVRTSEECVPEKKRDSRKQEAGDATGNQVVVVVVVVNSQRRGGVSWTASSSTPISLFTMRSTRRRDTRDKCPSRSRMFQITAVADASTRNQGQSLLCVLYIHSSKTVSRRLVQPRCVLGPWQL